MPELSTDTLIRTSADTIPGFDAPPMPAADTLPISLPDSIPAPPAEIWDAAAVYGAGSVRIPGGIPEVTALQSPLTDNILFHLLTLAALAAYCFMMYYYREQTVMCLRGLVNFKPENKFTGEHGHLYNNFMIYAAILCTFTAGIGITKAMAAIGVPAADFLPAPAIPFASLILWAAAAAVVAFRAGILKAAGKLTYSSAFTGALTEIQTMHMAAGAIFLTPAIILFSGINPVWDTAIIYIAVSIALIIIAASLFRTFLLFVRQKVSILVWILYLCAVEIFPLALATALIVNNF